MRFSLCMIVKNEERLLAECLDSLKDYMDEIIIVDTGSTDRTKEIAAGYTTNIYDFQWTGSFSDARNYSFSLATGDYIYCADADELLDRENQEKLGRLKECLDEQIEIVQMYYANQLQHGSVYNYDKEYRPKLFKRLRTFRFADPIHEQIVTEPLVFDSDIEIIHRQEESHADRDLLAFERMIDRNEKLSDRLFSMYARELYKAGSREHLERAFSYFAERTEKETKEELFKMSCLLTAVICRRTGEIIDFFKYAMKLVASDGCSEICMELGDFYMERKEYAEAKMWYHNAAYETAPILDIASGEEKPLKMLAECEKLC